MKFTDVPLVLDSQAPIATNGSEYNKWYLLGVLGAIIGFITAGPAGILFAAGGLIFGHVIKKDILHSKCKDLRKKVKFKLYAKVPYPELISELAKTLSPLGMTVEIDKNGNPVVTHNNIFFDVFYNDDFTFTIWYRKSIARAFLSDNYIKLYRNCVVSMGIIGYHVQQISKKYSQNNTDTQIELQPAENNSEK